MSGLKAAHPPFERVHELVDIGDHRAALIGLERGHGLQFCPAHGRDHLVAVEIPLVGEMDALDAFVVLAALQTKQPLGCKHIDDVVHCLAWQQCIRADLTL